MSLYRNETTEYKVKYVALTADEFETDEHFRNVGEAKRTDADRNNYYVIYRRAINSTDDWEEYGKYDFGREVECELDNVRAKIVDPEPKPKYEIAVCYITHTKYRTTPKDDLYETGELEDEYTNDDPYYEVMDGWGGECVEQFGTYEEAQALIKELEGENE